MVYILLLLLPSFAITPLNLANSYHYDDHQIPPPFLMNSTAWADSVLNSLSLEEKIAQLLMVAVYPGQSNRISEVRELIKEHNIGGVIVFQSSPEQQVSTVNNLQKEAKTPLLVAIDGEWGVSMRLSHTVKYPRQMMLGAIRDNELIYQMGADIGKQMKRLGIHVNFAPVVDINNNPDNPVINSRSFGENRDMVTYKGMSYMMGMQDQGIIATAKHFPGHGDTDVDSHFKLPYIWHDRHRLDSIELYPYRRLINNGIGAIMVGHLNIPALDSTSAMGSTLSGPIITDLLKKNYDFNGLVFTDALNMKGVTDEGKEFSPAEINRKAFLAGNDVLLMPDEISKTIKYIKEAVHKGNISEEEVNIRCLKLLKAKQWVGLDNYSPAALQNVLADINTVESKALNEKLTEKAITLVQNKNEILPLRNLEQLKIVSVNIGHQSAGTFNSYLNKYKSVESYFIDKNQSLDQQLAHIKNLEDYNTIIVSLHSSSINAAKKFGFTSQTFQFIDSLATDRKVVLNLLGNPYALDYLIHPDKLEAIVVSYQDNTLSQKYSAQLIFGGIPAQGRLPVSVASFKAGDGILIDNPIRLSYRLPEMVGMDSYILSQIDSLAQNAIDQQATPGCQVLVARNGAVVFEKSYGHHTYQKRVAVENDHLYDLASITKIGATLPIIMKLYEQNKISLDKPLANYYHPLDTTNKSDLLIKDILYHQAGLKPWIPFYMATLESLFPNEDISSNQLSEKYPYQLSNSYFLNKHVKYKDNFFSFFPSENFSIQVADGLFANEYIRDTIFNSIFQSDLRNRKNYKYSDLGFYMFYKTIEYMTQLPFDKMLSDSLYSPLGAETLGFMPLNRFDKSKIVPTENDIIFRKQLVHGFVHDPGAAMLGGVSGHAGLFSSAHDLAKLMQLYLNEGAYGGINFLADTTIIKFTSASADQNNRRGLGFDKPELRGHLPSPVCDSASAESYGHTGFTGTMSWVDPKEELIYIFLSNRVHPDAMNAKLIELDVRTEIQKAVYKSIREH
jgi:beta-glucosidase-like glycosyl hydrolase/CubicO group peptidase (beta-lactamase class C family)